MIVVDTSAIVAVLLKETPAEACAKVMDREEELLISAGTLAELFVVAARRSIVPRATELIDQLSITIVPVTEAMAHQVGATYARWGKGIHPAGLNFGDCFAYALAKDRGCPLLYVGADFARTDVAGAI